MDWDDIDFGHSRFLYALSLLDAGRQCGIDVQAFVDSLYRAHPGNVFVYPDGSVELDGRALVERFHETVGRRVRELSMEIELRAEAARGRAVFETLRHGGARYDSLPDFGPRTCYYLEFWGDFVAQLDAGHLVIRTTLDMTGSADPRVDVHNLPVAIAFKRRVTSQLAGQLAETLAAWARDGGMGGEGGGRLASRDLTVTKQLAQVQVDFSACGQKTVNWLLLRLLEISENNPITSIYFVSRPHPDLTFTEEYDLLHCATDHFAIPRDARR